MPSKRPRLLYLVGQLGVGGYERQLYYLLRALDRERYHPAVAVWGSTDMSTYASQIRALGIPVYTFRAELSPQRKLLGFRRLINELAPELLHSYSFFTNFAAWWAAAGRTTIPVGSIRNNFVSEIREAGTILGRLSARWPSIQICNSQAAKQAVENTAGPFKPSRVHLIPNALNIDEFTDIAPLPLHPMLLAVGRLHVQKRWDRLVNAVGEAHRRGLKFSVRHAGDGILRRALKKQAGSLGVEPLIEFLGVRSDVPALLADSSFLVHTADEEGCPNVVMEAMASGRAVVATDAGHSPVLVEDGKTGFIVPRGDDAALADRIAVLIQNRDLAAKMGQAGRAKAVRDFGLRPLVERTFAAYCEAGWKN
jgi:glycosyltransferase involved in cell wall biosynthesis